MSKTDRFQGIHPYFCSIFALMWGEIGHESAAKSFLQFRRRYCLIQDNFSAPPVVVTSLTQGTQPVEVDVALENVRSVTLEWPNNFFEFEFAALSDNQPERNQYAYMLEGFDETWNTIGANRFGRYTNVPGGTYTLKLKASNNDGIWNEQGTSLEVVVVPPFWQTTWFIAATFFVLAAAVIAGYRQRVYNIQARSDELEVQVEERTHEIEQRRHELEALFRADEELYSHLQLDEVLQALVDIAVDILKADKSVVLVWDDARNRFYACVARGFSQSSMRALMFERDEGITGHVATSGEAVVSEDAVDNPWRENERPDTVQAVLAEGIHSFMHLPIKKDDEIFGVFNVSYTSTHHFAADERRLSQHWPNVLPSPSRTHSVSKGNSAGLSSLERSAKRAAVSHRSWPSTNCSNRSCNWSRRPWATIKWVSGIAVGT